MDLGDEAHRQAVAFKNQYHQTGEIAHLAAAIIRYREALSCTPTDHVRQASRLQNLGAAYGERHQRLGALEDLDSSVRLNQEALDLTPDVHPKRAGRLQSVGAGYAVRYQALGAASDLRTAIQYFQMSVNSTSPDDPARPSCLQNLGLSYLDQFENTGVMSDCDRAILSFREALSLMPHGHLDRPVHMQNLGSGYRTRYGRLGAREDLDAAICLFEEASELVRDNHPRKSGCLQNLAAAYADRSQRTSTMADIENSAQRNREAAHRMPEDHPHRFSLLRSHAGEHLERYHNTGTISELETYIRLNQDILDRQPGDHPDKVLSLHNIGVGYGDKFEHTKEMAYISMAIQRFQEVLDLTPDNHADRTGHLHNLWVAYKLRYQHTGTTEDFEAAIKQHQEGLECLQSTPRDRLQCGRSLFDIYANAKQWLSAYETASQVMSLIPSFIPRSLKHSDKQYLVDKVQGLASDATAVALNAGILPYDALKLLELGRGIIAGSLSDLRADISALRGKHPDLSKEYTTLCDQLDDIDVSTNLDQRLEAAGRLETLIECVRKLPGFDRFLMVPTVEESKAAAAQGPIVVINTSEYRCDAFLIKVDQLKALHLPRLQSKDIFAHAEMLVKHDSVELELLEWLCDTVASPIIEVLGLVNASEAAWSRVWWITTGIFARFPIHAAGYHTEGSDTVLDRVISSYSSSVKSLIHSRRNLPIQWNPTESTSTVLLGMEMTPGYARLNFVSEEIRQLETLYESTRLQVTKPRPRQQDVLAAVRDCTIFHFAGHGLSNPVDPFESSLLLNEETLTVASLFKVNLRSRRPFLAYLSACGTGQVKHDRLIDEGPHLINACQLAGFQHIIGTLWEVNDESCVAFATQTHQWIQEHDMKDEAVSEGLHRACRTLRGQWMEENADRVTIRCGNRDPELSGQTQSHQGDTRDVEAVDYTKLNWVPYVHFGT